MLSTFFLFAALMLRGDVRDAAGAPVAGARITWSDVHASTTAADGAFAIDPGDDWPRDLVVSAAGYGTRVIPVPPLHAPTSLGRITLLPGATLRVHVERGVETRPLDLAIGLAGDEDEEARWVVHRHLDAGVSDATIPGLGRGAWIVLVRGPEPLQRATVKTVVAEKDTRSVEFALKRRRLRARILAGKTPVKNTEVRFGNLDERWDGTAKTDANGIIDTPLWDGGTFEVAVNRVPGATAVVRIVELRGGEMTIAIPDRTIRGTVTDPHGQPIGGATVHLGTTTDDGRHASLRARTNARGEFAFDGVGNGEQELRVFSPSYLVEEPMHITANDVHLILTEGYPREVVVTTRDGAAIAGAEVLCLTGAQLRARTLTDDHGRATIATPPREPSVLYVVPREGSLAIHRLRAPIDETSTAPVAIVVPRATASLRIDALSTSGDPIRELALLMRINGETIPPVVADTLTKMQGLSLYTAADGSARLDPIVPGTYEFWPYNSAEEIDALLESIGLAAAPINVNVITGENRATVRFQPRP